MDCRCLLIRIAVISCLRETVECRNLHRLIGGYGIRIGTRRWGIMYVVFSNPTLLYSATADPSDDLILSANNEQLDIPDLFPLLKCLSFSDSFLSL